MKKQKKMMVMFVLALVGILSSFVTAYASPLAYEVEAYEAVGIQPASSSITSFQVTPNSSWSNPMRPGGTYFAMGSVSNPQPGMFVDFVLRITPWDSRLPIQEVWIHRAPVLVNGHFDIGGLRTLNNNNISGLYSVEAWLHDSSGSWIGFRAGSFWFRREASW